MMYPSILNLFIKQIQAENLVMLNAKGNSEVIVPYNDDSRIPAVDLPHRDDGSRLTAFNNLANNTCLRL